MNKMEFFSITEGRSVNIFDWEKRWVAKFESGTREENVARAIEAGVPPEKAELLF